MLSNSSANRSTSGGDCGGQGDGYDDFAVLTSAAISGGNLVLSGFAHPGAEFDLYIAVFDGSGSGEGKTYLATLFEGDGGDAGLQGDAPDLGPTSDVCYGPTVNGLTVGEDCTERFQFEFPAPDGVVLGTVLTAHVIGSTSEFSNDLLVSDGEYNLVPVVDAGGNVVFAEGTTLERDGSFFDLDSSSWTAMVDYGDGDGFETLTLGADQTFQLNHLYASNGFFTVAVVVIDEHFGFGVDSFTVTVQNAPPESADNALSVEPKCDPPIVGIHACINEHEFATITGEFTDDGPLDTHTVEVDWGDGTTSFATITQVDETRRTYEATHLYRDDNPSGSSFDIYPIVATISDNSGDSDQSTYGLVFVQVNNVLPSDLEVASNALVIGDQPTIHENGVLLLSGSFDDPGTQDKHRVVINWGDGSSNTIVNVAPGVQSFSGIPHRYLDDSADVFINSGAGASEIIFEGDTGGDRFQNNGAEAGSLYISRRRWDRDETACDRFATATYDREMGSYRAAIAGDISQITSYIVSTPARSRAIAIYNASMAVYINATTYDARATVRCLNGSLHVCKGHRRFGNRGRQECKQSIINSLRR